MSLAAAPFHAALEALRAALSFAAPADAVLSRYFRENPKLGSHDRNFVAEAVFGVLRHKLTLDRICAPDPTPRRLLLAWLVRGGRNTREFEAIVGREDERAWLGQVKGFKNDTLALHEQAELPDWVVSELQASGMDDAAIVTLGKSLSQPAPLDLRVNTIKMKREAVMAELEASGIAVETTPYSPYGLRAAGKPQVNRSNLFKEGGFEVQDEGSQLLGLLLAPKRGEMVVDFCAGAGGKTLLLGMLMASSGRLYAFDVSEKRLANLKPRLARSGLSNVQPQRIEHENDVRVKRLAGKLDRVLVDAPCSGLGTLRRNPDLKFRQSAQSVDELNAKQASILNAAAKLLKVGGRLVYATCS
uniref:RsmB/NOP family class I SAM-dependent RNA methyltransferase n=1 Tax=Chitinimonas sp. TaxID=1934313 RepID=UPI0035AFD21D